MINYFPQIQDNFPTAIQYRVFDITGVWLPNTFELAILIQVRQPGDIAISPEPYSSPAFIGTAMRWQSPVGTLGRSLKNGAGISNDGKYYVGEGVNEDDFVIYPPEALITIEPVVGETFEGHSRVFASPTDNTVIHTNFHWQYKTIQHFDTWGHHFDCWRTGLWEYSSNHVYNYVFAGGVGMVDFWHGTLNENGQVVGSRFYFFP